MPSNTVSPTWLALYTRHRHEKSVAELLNGKGMVAFLPLYDAVRRWKDRLKHLCLPLFPNYVFVYSRSQNDRGAILSTPGIYDIVRIAGVPAPIPNEEIEAIQRVVEQGLKAEPHPFLKSGDRVRVKSGLLKDVDGILVRKKGFYRLVLSVELLARSISVEVEAADVERVITPQCGGNLPSHGANAIFS